MRVITLNDGSEEGSSLIFLEDSSLLPIKKITVKQEYIYKYHKNKFRNDAKWNLLKLDRHCDFKCTAGKILH